MKRSGWSRRLIALLAAYVVALQALLLPLTVAAGASLEGGLCATTASQDGPARPGSHDSTCACAAGCGMQCSAQTLAGPPQIALALGPTRIAMPVPMPAIEVVLPPPRRNPQVARAPPSV
jgi:hypothetical protein